MKTSFTTLILSVLLSEAARETLEQQTASLGGDVILRCEVSSSSIIAVEWTRTDLKDDEYVLFYRDGRSDLTQQHASFKGRVQLVDGQMKDGDVSLLLMNVIDEDAGTYECRVVLGGSTRRKRAVIDREPIKTIRLTVEDPSSSDRGYLGSVVAGVAVGVVLVLYIAGFFLLRYKRSAAETDKVLLV